MFDAKNRENAAYEALKTTYESAKTTYNAALKTEATRNNDILAQWFTAPTKIPVRPCPPDVPAAYVGPKIDWWLATSNLVNNVNATSRVEGYGVLDRMAATIMPKPSLNSGFVQAAPDISNGVTPNITFAGHTFGLLGQGNATLPTNGIAFPYRTVSTETHHMMLSLFPYDETDTTGVANGQTIEFRWHAVSWRTTGSFNAPA